jgi:hypothetical protein
MLYTVTDVTFEDITKDLGIYVDLILEHKVVFFAAPLYLDWEQNLEIMRLLYDHGLCLSTPIKRSVGIWTDNTGHNHHPAGSLKDGDDPRDYVKRNYHADTVETKRPASIISMSMLKYEATTRWEGETVWFDMEALYEKCPHKDYLETLNLDHCPLPGEEIQTHPALRTHPVTGKTALCMSNILSVPEGLPHNSRPRSEGQEQRWNDGIGYFDYSVEDEIPQEYTDYLKWFRAELEKDENRHWSQWEEGNFVIWDNRNTFHSFSGYEYGTAVRMFDKGIAGSDAVWYGEKPQIFITEEAEARDESPGHETPFSMAIVNDAHNEVLSPEELVSLELDFDKNDLTRNESSTLTAIQKEKNVAREQMIRDAAENLAQKESRKLARKRLKEAYPDSYSNYEHLEWEENATLLTETTNYIGTHADNGTPR